MKTGDMYNETLKTKYEDSLFAILMDKFAAEEGQRLLEENERLQQDCDFKLPEGFEARCEKTIDRAIAAKKRRAAGQKTIKTLAKVAVFFVICGIAFAVLFNSVSAFRIVVWKFFEREDATNTSISISESGEQNYNKQNIKIPSGNYLPTWLPDGYSLTSYSDTVKGTTAIFSDNKDNLIFYFEYGNGQVLGVNTYNADIVKNIEINRFDGLLVIKDNAISISWADVQRNRLVRIRTTDLDEETVISIAESVKKN